MAHNFKSFDRERFAAWLELSIPMSERSRRDVCSRLSRLAAMVDITGIRSGDDLRVALIRSSAFSDLGTSVRSQLKRAGLLYLRFLESKKADKKRP